MPSEVTRKVAGIVKFVAKDVPKDVRACFERSVRNLHCTIRLLDSCPPSSCCCRRMTRRCFPERRLVQHKEQHGALHGRVKATG